VGRLAGASIIVTGQLMRRHDGGLYSVVVHIIGAANARVFVEEAEGRAGAGNTMNLRPVGAELARKVIETLFRAPRRIGGFPVASR